MRNLFLQFWPKIKKSNSSKIIEISALVKIYSTKLNFLSQFFVYVVITIEQLYKKN